MESFPAGKRRDSRFPIEARVRFRLVESPDGAAPEPELHNGNNVIWNISRTGLFLATKNFVEIHSTIEVEFPLDDFKTTLRSEAEVVRANFMNNTNQGRYEYGLRFTKMTEEFKQTLDKFISLIEREN
jgi:c-di-GMP-binding flagellar brake protein YcgR